MKTFLVFLQENFTVKKTSHKDHKFLSANFQFFWTLTHLDKISPRPKRFLYFLERLLHHRTPLTGHLDSLAAHQDHGQDHIPYYDLSYQSFFKVCTKAFPQDTSSSSLSGGVSFSTASSLHSSSPAITFYCPDRNCAICYHVKTSLQWNSILITDQVQYNTRGYKA